MPGMGELVIILLIVLVVFGANKLPGIGDALGRSIKNFKRATGGNEDESDKDKDEKDTKQVAGGTPAKQLEKGKAKAGADDDEWEEVVVRRRKKSASSES